MNLIYFCLVDGCDIPTTLKDYQENKTLSQVAQCLANIEMLLLNNMPGETDRHTKSSRRQMKSKTLSELKQVASSEPRTKAKTRTRTMSNQVKKEKPAKESSVKKRGRRLSLPEPSAGSSRRGSTGNVSKEKPRLQRNTLEKKNVKGESKLHVACNKGEVEKVKELLRAGADPNTQDHAGWTPLHDVVSNNRLDIARILLEAEANPSVPSHDERITALHDAVTNNQEEMVRLLVSRGADRDAKNKQGQTPRYLAGQFEDQKMSEVLESTKVLVNLNETLKNNSLPKKKRISLSRRVVKQQPSLIKLCSELCQSAGMERVTGEVSQATTHLVMEEKESAAQDSFHYLAALALGAVMVRPDWLTESLEKGKIVPHEKFVLQFASSDLAGVGKVQEMAAAQQPGLMAGIHFYLTSNLQSGPGLAREDLATLIKLTGGRLITREPDPEGIPEDEVSLPHHASHDSALAQTSHVLLYRAGEGEPLIKYNMNHVKSLPVSWLVNSIRSGSLVDPQ